MAIPAITDDHGAFRFTDQKSMYEIQRSNNFEFTVDLSGLTSISDGTTFVNPEQSIQIACASAFVPHYKQNVIEVRRGNTGVKYAGVMTFSSGSIDLYDFIGIETKNVLMAWQALSGDPLAQTVGLQQNYKKDAYIIEYTPDYSEMVRTWKLSGCWISEISEDPYSVDQNGAHKIKVTIEYDRAVMEND